MAFKRHVQAVGDRLENKLDNTAIQNNALIDQLASKVIESKSDAENNVLKLEQRVNKLSNELPQVKDTLNENVTLVKIWKGRASNLLVRK